MLALKILIIGSFAALVILLIRVSFLGIKLRNFRGGQVTKDYVICYLNHQFYADAAFYLATASVIFTELMVRLQGGFTGKSLFWIHLCFALPFFITLIFTRFYFNGTKNPSVHK